ncbi:hypothetical protein [Bradyrhizobium septentrionale]|uniref:Uncharacterized protein n=1 Tax=Bradyrhizobium septentrionale TaxID=1404411 RepID=A0A973W0L0_9BRAD|nr:hypothetical protein [Bradyrhizobium septentrionale]UGY14052.1 hypothetical protein HAP48_0036650 [Bradyrhizobium septentrionale]UGY22607.1 hypothetical protein HU675_0032150 [Bradyrhizobium septentrionale]
MERISDEIKRFGINTIGAVEKLVTTSFLRSFKEYMRDESGVSFLRLIILYDDIEGYFKRAQPKWGQMPRDAFKLLSSKYGEENVLRLLTVYDKKLQEDDSKEQLAT